MLMPYGLTVNLTVKIVKSALNSFLINALEVPLMIEWE